MSNEKSWTAKERDTYAKGCLITAIIIFGGPLVWGAASIYVLWLLIKHLRAMKKYKTEDRCKEIEGECECDLCN